MLLASTTRRRRPASGAALSPAATVRRLRPPGPWARARRSRVALSATARLRRRAPLARVEASRSSTPDRRSTITGQWGSTAEAACTPITDHAPARTSSLKFARMGPSPSARGTPKRDAALDRQEGAIPSARGNLPALGQRRRIPGPSPSAPGNLLRHPDDRLGDRSILVHANAALREEVVGRPSRRPMASRHAPLSPPLRQNRRSSISLRNTG